MIRLCIVVEGLTEEVFVNDVLTPHLLRFDVEVVGIQIGQGRRSRKGGNVSVQRIVEDWRHNRRSFQALTTLVDFYGFRNRPAGDVGEVEAAIDKAAEEAIGPRNWREDLMFSYVQRHEFEALLFSRVDAFEALGIAKTEGVQELAKVRKSFRIPEDINDSSATAPSKRIIRVLPGYSKSEYGPLVAAEIGLDTIRQECPRFGQWVSRLEALGTGAPPS